MHSPKSPAFFGLTVLLLLVLLAPGYVYAREIGSFHLNPHKDRMDDADRSSIINLGTDLRRNTPTLGWKCMEDGLNVILLLGGFMGGDRDDNVVVRYRFDSKPASNRQHWELFRPDKETTWMPMRLVGGFTKEALAAKEVHFEVTDPLDNETRRNTFNLDGLRGALRTLTCARSE